MQINHSSCERKVECHCESKTQKCVADCQFLVIISQFILVVAPEEVHRCMNFRTFRCWEKISCRGRGTPVHAFDNIFFNVFF